MNLPHPEILRTLGGVLVVLCLASATGAIVSRRKPGPTSANLVARINAWWIMCLVFGTAILLGRTGSTLLFALMSFLALREFITLTPSARGDHRTLFWAFFAVLPLQYWLVWKPWYGLFVILIPVYAFLWLPVRTAMAGDCTRFLERTAKIQWALMICVYCVSHVPMLLSLPIAGYEGKNALLVIFLVVVVQASDVLQYIWGKLCGCHKIAPLVSPNKTVEGFLGGIASATALGTALYPLTPFRPWQAAVIALIVCLLGFAGGLVMSAIKRDRGVKDYGSMISGHGGMMDRIDSLSFAAPVFLHIVRFWWT